MMAADSGADRFHALLQNVVAENFRAAADAGETFQTAYELASLDEPQNHQGWVGWWDRLDVMRFSITRESEVDIAIRELTADLDLFLYDSRGQRIAASDNGGSRSESIRATLDAGTFHVVVDPWRWAASPYELSLAAAPLSPPLPVSPPAGAAPPELPMERLPDVPYHGGTNEWNLNAVSAPEAWAAGFTGDGVTVAVVDTGVDLGHSDLISNIWVNAGEIAGNGIDDDWNGFVDDVQGWDFAAGDNRPDDRNGHGTHVAGTIAAAANAFGATGVSPDATIMPVRVLGANGSGASFNVAAGIRYAAENGADIINLSLGGGFNSAIWSAIEYAGRLGSFVIAAAGNESSSAPGYPARFSAELSHVISVGAHSVSDQIATFSNDVGITGAVQVDAPGLGVLSTYVGGRYARLSGTSMAAPHVAGLAALALSANPQLTASQLRNLVVAGAERTIGGSDSSGGISAAVTVAMAASFQGIQPPLAAVPTGLGGGDPSRFGASFVRTNSTSDLALASILPSTISYASCAIPSPRFAPGDSLQSVSSSDLPSLPILPQSPSEQFDLAITDMFVSRRSTRGLEEALSLPHLSSDAAADLGNPFASLRRMSV